MRKDERGREALAQRDFGGLTTPRLLAILTMLHDRANQLGAQVRFSESALRLEPGDVLVLYTNGVTEAMDDQGQPFGLESLRRELLPVVRRSVEEIKDHLFGAVRGILLS